MRSDVRSGIDWFELHGARRFRRRPGRAAFRVCSRRCATAERTITLDDGTTGIAAGGVAAALGGHRRRWARRPAITSASRCRRWRCSTRRWRRSRPFSVDERFARVRDELSSFSGIAPLDAAPSFAGQLRDYQREALGWFAFLRQFGFGGCLADDMGLGKTVMVLAWLDRLRADRSRFARRRWSSSRDRVVFNWKEEAARFAPKLRVLDFSGSSTARSTGSTDYDLVLTSYGTLRRDALLLQGHRVRVRHPRRGADDQERRNRRRPRRRGCCAASIGWR